MYTSERIVCLDGVVRYNRKNNRTARVVTKKKLDIPVEIEQFAESFNKLAHHILGEALHFQGKNWSRKKISFIERTLNNIKKYGIPDTELFLYAQFDHWKKQPKSIYPSNIASISAIKVYNAWVSKFVSLKEAKKVLEFKTLQDLLESNHKRYLYYRETIGWSDTTIFSMKAIEFDPLYLLSIPNFKEYTRVHPECLQYNRGRLAEALTLLNNRESREEYWQLIRRVKCQSQTSSTSYSKTK